MDQGYAELVNTSKRNILLSRRSDDCKKYAAYRKRTVPL